MRCLMPLTVVAWRDICLMMLQDHDYEAHISNTAKVSGKSMNLKQMTEQWNKAEADFVDSCIDAMHNGNMEQEAMFDLQPEKFLVPPKKARHKVPATFSKTNPTQKQKPTKRKLHQDSENDTNNNNNDFVNIPDVVEEQKLGYNPPHLVLLCERVIVCSGCEIPTAMNPTTWYLSTCCFEQDQMAEVKWFRTIIEVLGTSMHEIWDAYGI